MPLGSCQRLWVSSPPMQTVCFCFLLLLSACWALGPHGQQKTSSFSRRPATGAAVITGAASIDIAGASHAQHRTLMSGELDSGEGCSAWVNCQQEVDIRGRDLAKITRQTEESCAQLCCERADCEFWVLDYGAGCYLKKNATAEADGSYGHIAHNVRKSCWKALAAAGMQDPLAGAYQQCTILSSMYGQYATDLLSLCNVCITEQTPGICEQCLVTNYHNTQYTSLRQKKRAAALCLTDDGSSDDISSGAGSTIGGTSSDSHSGTAQGGEDSGLQISPSPTDEQCTVLATQHFAPYADQVAKMCQSCVNANPSRIGSCEQCLVVTKAYEQVDDCLLAISRTSGSGSSGGHGSDDHSHTSVSGGAIEQCSVLANQYYGDYATEAALLCNDCVSAEGSKAGQCEQCLVVSYHDMSLTTLEQKLMAAAKCVQLLVMTHNNSSHDTTSHDVTSHDGTMDDDTNESADWTGPMGGSTGHDGTTDDHTNEAADWTDPTSGTSNDMTTAGSKPTHEQCVVLANLYYAEDAAAVAQLCQACVDERTTMAGQCEQCLVVASQAPKKRALVAMCLKGYAEENIAMAGDVTGGDDGGDTVDNGDAGSSNEDAGCSAHWTCQAGVRYLGTEVAVTENETLTSCASACCNLADCEVWVLLNDGTCYLKKDAVDGDLGQVGGDVNRGCRLNNTATSVTGSTSTHAGTGSSAGGSDQCLVQAQYYDDFATDLYSMCRACASRGPSGPCEQCLVVNYHAAGSLMYRADLADACLNRTNTGSSSTGGHDITSGGDDTSDPAAGGNDQCQVQSAKFGDFATALYDECIACASRGPSGTCEQCLVVSYGQGGSLMAKATMAEDCLSAANPPSNATATSTAGGNEQCLVLSGDWGDFAKDVYNECHACAGRGPSGPCEQCLVVNNRKPGNLMQRTDAVFQCLGMTNNATSSTGGDDTTSSGDNTATGSHDTHTDGTTSTAGGHEQCQIQAAKYGEEFAKELYDQCHACAGRGPSGPCEQCLTVNYQKTGSLMERDDMAYECLTMTNIGTSSTGSEDPTTSTTSTAGGLEQCRSQADKFGGDSDELYADCIACAGRGPSGPCEQCLVLALASSGELVDQADMAWECLGATHVQDTGNAGDAAGGVSGGVGGSSADPCSGPTAYFQAYAAQLQRQCSLCLGRGDKGPCLTCLSRYHESEDTNLTTAAQAAEDCLKNTWTTIDDEFPGDNVTDATGGTDGHKTDNPCGDYAEAYGPYAGELAPPCETCKAHVDGDACEMCLSDNADAEDMKLVDKVNKAQECLLALYDPTTDDGNITDDGTDNGEWHDIGGNDTWDDTGSTNDNVTAGSGVVASKIAALLAEVLAIQTEAQQKLDMVGELADKADADASRATNAAGSNYTLAKSAADDADADATQAYMLAQQLGVLAQDAKEKLDAASGLLKGLDASSADGMQGAANLVAIEKAASAVREMAGEASSDGQDASKAAENAAKAVSEAHARNPTDTTIPIDTTVNTTTDITDTTNTTDTTTTDSTTDTTTETTNTTGTVTATSSSGGCDKFYILTSNSNGNRKAVETCWDVAVGQRISLEDLEEANPDMRCADLHVNQTLCVDPSYKPKGQNTNHEDDSVSASVSSPHPPPSHPPPAPSAIDLCASTYKIQAGDTCRIIASNHSITVAELKEANPDRNHNNSFCHELYVGDTICIPGPAEANSASLGMLSADGTNNVGDSIQQQHQGSKNILDLSSGQLAAIVAATVGGVLLVSAVVAAVAIAVARRRKGYFRVQRVEDHNTV